jgi:hypothetical protein
MAVKIDTTAATVTGNHQWGENNARRTGTMYSTWVAIARGV